MARGGLTAIITLAATVLLSGAGWLWLPRANAGPAPDVTFTTLKGEHLPLKSLRGHPVLVTFWATTCTSCLREIPRLVKLQNALGPHGLTVVAVAMPYDPPSRVLELAQSRHLPYKVALDVDGTVTSAFPNVDATPMTFLVDSEGQLIWRASGPLDMARLRSRIARLLGRTG